MGESINTLEYEVREWQERRVYKNRDEKCWTMKGRVGGVLEVLGNRQNQVEALREVMQ